MAQVGRDWGKALESELFNRWGGKPTTRLLRHRDTPNRVLLTRYHRRLEQLIPDLTIPTADQEAQNPRNADEVYDAATAYLIERTRDRTVFHHIFEENCSYGFRRNLYAMRTLGIATSTTAVGLLTGLLFVQGFLGIRVYPPSLVGALALDLALASVWFLAVSEDWVRVAAYAYAQRLLGALDQL